MDSSWVTELVATYWWAPVLAIGGAVFLALGIYQRVKDLLKDLWGLRAWLKKTPDEAEVNPPVVEVLPPPRISLDKRVFGRDQALIDLDKGLVENGKAQVSGGAGYGKTTLARGYAQSYASHYACVLWVSAETRNGAFERIVTEAARVLGNAPPAMMRQAEALMALDGLAKLAVERNKPLLVVYDNLEARADVADLMPTGAAHVIVTTRLPEAFDGYARIDVDVLAHAKADDAAVDMLIAETGVADTADARAAALALAQDLGGLPLGLTIMAGVAGQIGFDQARADLLAHIETAATDPLYPKSLSASIMVSWDRLDQQARWVAGLCAWWAPEGLEIDLILDAPQGQWWAVFVDDLPEGMAEWIAQPALVRKAWLAVRGTHLLMAPKGAAADAKAPGLAPAQMHRLAGLALRTGAAAELGPAAAAVLMAQYPLDADFVRNWALCRRLTPHARAIWDRAPEIAPRTKGMDTVLNQCGGFLASQRDVAGAAACYRVSLELKRELSEPSSRDVPLALGNLAQELAKLPGQAAAARARIAEALALNEQHRAGSADLASSYVQAALIERHLHDNGADGDWAKARGWVSKARDIRVDLFGAQSEPVAHCATTLASIEDAAGRKEAEVLAQVEALQITRGMEAPDLNVLAARLNNLGGVMLEVGLPAEAVQVLGQALKIVEEIFPPGHINIQGTAGWLTLAHLTCARAGIDAAAQGAAAEGLAARLGLDMDRLRAIAHPLSPRDDLGAALTALRAEAAAWT